MLKNNTSLVAAVSPVLDSGLTLKDFRLILGEMYVNSVSNAPDNELEQFTARRQGAVYLALAAMLENLEEIEK